MFDCYDYESAVYDDFAQWVTENYGNEEYHETSDEAHALAGFMRENAAELAAYKCGDDANAEKCAVYALFNDKVFTADNVTGNGSGSYWFSRAKASEALSCNFDLLARIAGEYAPETLVSVIQQGPEAADVAIRCMILPEAINKYLSEYFDEAREELNEEEEQADNE